MLLAHRMRASPTVCGFTAPQPYLSPSLAHSHTQTLFSSSILSFLPPPCRHILSPPLSISTWLHLSLWLPDRSSPPGLPSRSCLVLVPCAFPRSADQVLSLMVSHRLIILQAPSRTSLQSIVRREPSCLLRAATDRLIV